MPEGGSTWANVNERQKLGRDRHMPDDWLGVAAAGEQGDRSRQATLLRGHPFMGGRMVRTSGGDSDYRPCNSS